MADADPLEQQLIDRRVGILERAKELGGIGFLQDTVDEYLAKIDELDALREIDQEDGPRGFGDIYRWDKRGDLEFGFDGLTGSSWWASGDRASPLVNATFGDDTVYGSASADGSRGFLDGEMKRSYVKKIRARLETNQQEGTPDEKVPDETWHLYRIRPTADQRAVAIHMKDFLNSATSKRVAPVGAGLKVQKMILPLTTTPKTDAERVRLLNGMPTTYRRMMETGALKQMSPEVHERFMKMMTTSSVANSRPYSLREGKPYYLRPDTYHTPPLSIAALRRAVARSPVTEADFDALDRAFLYAYKELPTIDSRLSVLLKNTVQTDEVQIPGPVDPANIDKLGTHTFRHDDLVDQVPNLYNSLLDPHGEQTLHKPLPDDPDVIELLGKQELAGESDV